MLYISLILIMLKVMYKYFKNMTINVVFLFYIVNYTIVGDKVRLFDKLDRYLVDNEYKVTIEKDRVHIINYIEIMDFSSNRVVVRYRGGFTTLEGVDLVVSKMMDDELVIEGKLKSIEYN